MNESPPYILVPHQRHTFPKSQIRSPKSVPFPCHDWIGPIYSAAIRPPPSRTTNHESRNLDSDNIGARRGKANSRIPYETRLTVTARRLNEPPYILCGRQGRHFPDTPETPDNSRFKSSEAFSFPSLIQLKNVSTS